MAVYPINNQWSNPSQYFGVGGNDPNGYSTNTIRPNNQIVNNSSMNNIMVVPVNGLESAESYPVAIGLTVMLLDYDNKIFWLKSNNGISTKLTKHIFTIEEPKEPKTVEPPKPIPNTDAFVTKEDFNSLNEKVNKLLKNLGESED